MILRLHDLPKKDSESVASKLIREFNLRSHANRPIFKLSEGLKRKSIVIPVLFGLEKRLYILDEPFEFLDYETRLEIVNRLRKLRDDGASVVISTHNIYEAKQVLDKAIILRNQLVKILEGGEVQMLEKILTTIH